MDECSNSRSISFLRSLLCSETIFKTGTKINLFFCVEKRVLTEAGVIFFLRNIIVLAVTRQKERQIFRNYSLYKIILLSDRMGY